MAWFLVFIAILAIGNSSPADERRKERIDALLAKRENGRPLQEVKDEVDFHTNLYNAYIKNNDSAGLIRIYDPNTMAITYDGTITKGQEAINSAHELMKSVDELNMMTLSVTPLGKNARFVFQHEHFDAKDANGNRVASGETFIIWKRYGDGLRLFIELFDDALSM